MFDTATHPSTHLPLTHSSGRQRWKEQRTDSHKVAGVGVPPPQRELAKQFRQQGIQCGSNIQDKEDG